MVNSSNSAPIGTGYKVSGKEIREKITAGYLYLKKNITGIIASCVLGAVLGALFSIVNKPVYTAVSTFVLEEKPAGGIGGYAGLASQFGISLGADQNSGLFQGDNIIELYKSRLMLQKTLLTPVFFNGKKQLLINRYIDAEGQRAGLEKLAGPLSANYFDSPMTFTVKQDSIVSEIVNELNKKRLAVSRPDKKLSIIMVTVTSHDELFAKSFNEKLVENVNQFYINTKLKNAIQNVKILKSQADSIRNLLNRSFSVVAASVDASPNANPFMQNLKVPSQKGQVDVQTNTALYAEVVKNLELAQITLRQEEPLIQIIDSPVLPLEKTTVGLIKGIILGWVFGCLVSCGFLTVKKLLA